MAILELEDVRVTFRLATGEQLTALDGMDLSVEEGELVALVGPSGCGKTTVLNVLAGEVRPERGAVRCAGVPVDGVTGRAGYVSQADALLPWRTVLDNVALGLELRGVPRRTRRDRARALMESIGLAGFEESFPGELSGGMRKRAAIARVLALGPPEVLMLDEPFSPLDALTRQRLQDDILDLWDRTGCTIVYVTHDLSARPGRVVREYRIDLPRPRRVMDVKLTPRFAELERAIWTDLRAELGEVAP